MEITEQQLREFMRLCEEHTGKPINREDALVQAEKLLRLVRLLRPYRIAKRPDPGL